MLTRLRRELARWRARRGEELRCVRAYDDVRQVHASIGKVDEHWRARIDEVKACPDNAYIPRVATAGALNAGWLTLHNGVQVSALGYYGAGIFNMLIENKGVHEPQEERTFGAVLALLPENCTMIELGAYWGAYSLWLKSARPKAQCILIEPSWCNLQSGRLNFRKNGVTGRFYHAFVGEQEHHAWFGVPTITVDGFCRKHRIHRIHLLHADIQGAELGMLHGAAQMLATHGVDYIFISTHSNELHGQCAQLLESQGYHILASANLDETYSVDGVLVARGPHVTQPQLLPISRKPCRQATVPAHGSGDTLNKVEV